MGIEMIWCGRLSCEGRQKKKFFGSFLIDNGFSTALSYFALWGVGSWQIEA